MGENSTFVSVSVPSDPPPEADSRFIAGETFESRYKITELVEDAGRIRYGLWEPPEIRIFGNETRFTVTPNMEHRPDLIAKQFYGSVTFWWAIMNANSILLPIRDLVAGMTIIIPFKEEIDISLQRVRK